jgi:4-amino-4-deoxy-L-arabinose transferase-like glycosyltransferase
VLERVAMRRSVSFLLGALAIAALAAAVNLPGISDQPYYTKGEPREAMVVWEMAHDGGLVLPLRNGTEIPSKPPFFHWLGLLSSRALGEVSELSVRLPSAVLGILATVAVYAFGAWTGRLRSGALAATALVLSFEWLRAARSARVDMTLTFFLTAAFLLFGVMDRTGVTRFRLVLFYACIAAASLGKGPVGIALPALVVLIYAAIRPPGDPDSLVGARPAPGAGGATVAPGWRARLSSVVAAVRDLAPVPGIAAVLLVVGGWYAAALWIGGDSFFVKQVLKENVFRVIDPERLDTGHVHGPLYFVPGFLLGALPWSLMAPAIAWWIWRSRPVDATTRYLVVWFLTVIGVFSIAASKRTVYILPAYPAAALLFGRVLGPGPEGGGQRRLASTGFVLGAVSIALIGLAGLLLASGLPIASWVGPRLEAHDAQGLAAAMRSLQLERWTAIGAALVSIAAAAGAAREAPGAHWLRGTALLAISLVALLGGVVAPVERGIAWSRSLDSFLRDVRARVGDAPLGFLCTYDYGAVYYSQRYFPGSDTPRCTQRDARGGHCRDHVRELLEEKACADPARRLAALRSPDAPRHLLIWEDELGALAPEVDVILRSEGSGPKGRARMLLVETKASGAGA